MAFGGVACLDRPPRSAMGHADTDSSCAGLHANDFDGLVRDRPHLALQLLRHLAVGFSHTVRRDHRTLRRNSR